MQQKFEFVDATKNDRLTRRLARSHALKGKNAGKKLHRRSRLELDQRQRHPPTPHSQDAQDQSTPESLTYPVDRNVCCDLQSIAFPIEATSQSRLIINQFFTIVMKAMYPPQLCRSLDDVKTQWLDMLFADRTSYHCAIALMGTMNAFFFGKDDHELMPSDAMYHLGQAVGLVNQNLYTADALSDSSLAVVNFLVVNELLRESRSRARIHLRGLQKMIELRGGLSELSAGSPLALKICKTALDYALHYGTSTYFYRDRMSDVADILASEGFSIDRSLFHGSSKFSKMDPFLQQILVDVNNITSLCNMDETGFRLGPVVFQEIIISVGCRLLRFHRLGEPPLKNNLESACHTGLTVFLTTLFIQLGRRRFLKYGLVGQYLKEVVERGLGERDNDLLLWLLLFGGISVLGGLEEAWLFPRIRLATCLAGVKTWEGVRQTLSHLPWVNSLHSEPGKELWESALDITTRGAT